MRRSMKIACLMAAGLAVVATSATATTGPAHEAATPLAYGTCSGSWVTVTDFQAVRAKPTAASTRLFDVIPGERRPCRKVVTGTQYNACGVYNATAWIQIQDFDREYGQGPGWSGFIPSVCTYDGVSP